jgi:hypothetical protein
VPVTSGTVSGGNASANYTLPGSTPSAVYTIQAAYSGTTNLLTSSDNPHPGGKRRHDHDGGQCRATFNVANQTVRSRRP